VTHFGEKNERVEKLGFEFEGCKNVLVKKTQDNLKIIVKPEMLIKYCVNFYKYFGPRQWWRYIEKLGLLPFAIFLSYNLQLVLNLSRIYIVVNTFLFDIFFWI
jgi:hypothetical protein